MKNIIFFLVLLKTIVGKRVLILHVSVTSQLRHTNGPCIDNEDSLYGTCGICLLIVPVPVHCFSLTFTVTSLFEKSLGCNTTTNQIDPRARLNQSEATHGPSSGRVEPKTLNDEDLNLKLLRYYLHPV